MKVLKYWLLVKLIIPVKCYNYAVFRTDSFSILKGYKRNVPTILQKKIIIVICIPQMTHHFYQKLNVLPKLKTKNYAVKYIFKPTNLARTFNGIQCWSSDSFSLNMFNISHQKTTAHNDQLHPCDQFTSGLRWLFLQAQSPKSSLSDPGFQWFLNSS